MKYIKTAYIKQLLFIGNNKASYTLSSCLNSALALYTSTVIYQDLSLKLVEEFEDEIEWEKEREKQATVGKIEYSKPFISHLNLKTKTFITLINMSSSKEDVLCGLLLMLNISKTHSYSYFVAMTNDDPKIKYLCSMLQIPTKNIIIFNEESIEAIFEEITHRTRQPTNTNTDKKKTNSTRNERTKKKQN